MPLLNSATPNSMLPSTHSSSWISTQPKSSLYTLTPLRADYLSLKTVGSHYMEDLLPSIPTTLKTQLKWMRLRKRSQDMRKRPLICWILSAVVLVLLGAEYGRPGWGCLCHLQLKTTIPRPLSVNGNSFFTVSFSPRRYPNSFSYFDTSRRSPSISRNTCTIPSRSSTEA
jgi:hypothetical protein